MVDCLLKTMGSFAHGDHWRPGNGQQKQHNGESSYIMTVMACGYCILLSCLQFANPACGPNLAIFMVCQ